VAGGGGDVLVGGEVKKEGEEKKGVVRRVGWRKKEKIAKT